MPSTTRTDGPRHMASGPHRSAGSRRRRGEHLPTSPGGQDATEAPPAARVHRSRLAFASAVTVAALPILVLDNFPATADTAGQVAAVAEVVTTEAPRTTAAPTTSTEAPTTTVAPTTTAAPTTTEAPATTTTAAPVRALAAPRPTPTTEAPPAADTAPSTTYGDPADPATWDRLAQCEASGDWAANTGNGYYGGLQFSKSAWESNGGIAYADYPHHASREQQIAVGQRLHARSGWSAWPGCASKLGYS